MLKGRRAEESQQGLEMKWISEHSAGRNKVLQHQLWLLEYVILNILDYIYFTLL